MTIGDSTSRKLSDGRAWKLSVVGVFLGNGTEVRMGSTYKQGDSSGGEDIRKWMDVPLQMSPYNMDFDGWFKAA
jgi:hypothetical protein